MNRRIVSNPGTLIKCAATKVLNGVELSCDRAIGHYTYLCKDDDADVEFHAPDRRVVLQSRRR